MKATAAEAGADIATDTNYIMILIADSGATKTDWFYGNSSQNGIRVETNGLNPFHICEKDMRQTIAETLFKKLEHPEQCTDIFFYGSGCTPNKRESFRNILQETFPKAEIRIDTDLTGAARALFGDQAGIACILGTGSNSGLYDGEKIIDNIPPLGYILGDEGSGAYLGKRFIADCLKRRLPETILSGLLDELRLSTEDILGNIYHKPNANRFLAQITPYIYRVRFVPEVKDFLNDCFSDFFQRNIIPYRSPYPISFVGSVAYYFEEEIRNAASKMRLTIGRFIQYPLMDIVKYHLNKKQ